MAKKDKSFKVTHIMSDGTRKDSLKGCVLPYTKETMLAYQIIIDVANDCKVHAIEQNQEIIT